MYDTIIVGGGPAGLSAALILGRCRRRVLVCDSGQPRNAASHAMHGFLTRDGIHPAEFLRTAREELGTYDVELRAIQVSEARRDGVGFEVTLEDGTRLQCRKLLLATGIVDRVPNLEGFEPLYGHSVHHCPYCDGWEVRDQPLAVYGRGKHGLMFSLTMRRWSQDLILFTDGPALLRKSEREKLKHLEIKLCETRIARLEGTEGKLERIVLVTDEIIARRALFFTLGWNQRSDLAARLGCKLTRKAGVHCNKLGETCVPGLYVAGDTSRDVQLVIVAAAEGTKAAFAINTALQKQDCA
ncbi:MAG: NAD(P)/FAD-dependent oxidoreductase [Gammaproteobacteria bacterium]